MSDALTIGGIEVEVAPPGLDLNFPATPRRFKFRVWDPERQAMEATSCIDWAPPRVLMQWTGLVNHEGQEVYEGDIVEAWSEGQRGVFEVRWRQSGSPLFLLYPAWEAGRFWQLHGSWRSDGTWRDQVKVLGNIYQHPDLRPGSPGSL